MQEKIKDIYSENVQTQIQASTLLPEVIVNAAQEMCDCLLRGNKIIVCAYGRSVINAQYLVANLLNRYELERPSLPSLLLSTEGAIGAALVADQRVNNLYQRQFEAVAQVGDILFLFAPLANEEPLLNLINCANDKEIRMITLTGSSYEHLQGLLGEQDYILAIPSKRESRIIENHLFIINSLCELIDYQLFS